jgi:hypothetical protein
MICELFGLKITRTVFTGLTSKPVATVFTDLDSKPVATIFTGLASKLLATVFADLASKSVATVFAGLGSKPVTTVSVEMVLRHFHRCRYRSSTVVVLLLEGLRSHEELAIREYGGHEDLRGSGRRSVIPYVHG